MAVPFLSRGRRRRGVLVGLLVALSVIAAACGGGDDDDGGLFAGATSEGGASSNEEAGSPDDGGVADSVDFQERAGAACARFFGDFFDVGLPLLDPVTGEPQPGTEDELGARLVELADGLTSELRSIGPPSDQVDEWTEWIGLLEESIDEVRDDPAAFIDDESEDTARTERIDELSEELGVPGCSDPEFDELDPDQLGDESAEVLAGLIAQGIRESSDGLVTESEAACIADGFLDEFSFFELVEFSELDLDIGDLPRERQAAVVDVMTGCLPTEKLLEFSEL